MPTGLGAVLEITSYERIETNISKHQLWFATVLVRQKEMRFPGRIMNGWQIAERSKEADRPPSSGRNLQKNLLYSTGYSTQRNTTEMVRLSFYRFGIHAIGSHSGEEHGQVAS